MAVGIGAECINIGMSSFHSGLQQMLLDSSLQFLLVTHSMLSSFAFSSLRTPCFSPSNFCRNEFFIEGVSVFSLADLLSDSPLLFSLALLTVPATVRSTFTFTINDGFNGECA